MADTLIYPFNRIAEMLPRKSVEISLIAWGRSNSDHDRYPRCHRPQRKAQGPSGLLTPLDPSSLDHRSIMTPKVGSGPIWAGDFANAKTIGQRGPQRVLVV